MSDPTPPTGPQPPQPGSAEYERRRNRFVLVISFFSTVFVLAVLVQVWRIYDQSRYKIGDGGNVESYLFDLSNLTVRRDLLVASGLPRDGQPVADDPKLVTLKNPEDYKRPGPKIVALDVVDEVNSRPFDRLIVSEDVVVGVAIHDEARAYPVRLLRWHEIINDTLGGVPIAVTHSLLCDSTAVFDRRVGDATLKLGFSGLLYNSNLLMYDRQPEGTAQSLWSQLKFESIAGPHAGQKLTLLPMWYGDWKTWRQMHPQTTVFRGDYVFRDRYKRDPSIDVFENGEPRFPVDPLPPADHPSGRKKTDVVFCDKPSGPDGGDWVVETAPPPPQPGEAPQSQGRMTRVRARWFAWYAMHADANANTDASP